MKENEKQTNKREKEEDSFSISEQYLFIERKFYWNQDKSNAAECANGKRENHFRMA